MTDFEEKSKICPFDLHDILSEKALCLSIDYMGIDGNSSKEKVSNAAKVLKYILWRASNFKDEPDFWQNFFYLNEINFFTCLDNHEIIEALKLLKDRHYIDIRKRGLNKLNKTGFSLILRDNSKRLEVAWNLCQALKEAYTKIGRLKK